MQRIALAALACVVLSCIGPSRTPGRLTAVAMTTAALALAIDASNNQCASEPEFGVAFGCAIDQGVNLGVATMLAVVGIGVFTYNELRRLPAPEPEIPFVEEPRTIAHVDQIVAPATEDPTLRQLTLQASVAARAGQCGAVRTVAGRVAQRDQDYARTRFVADAWIASCLR